MATEQPIFSIPQQELPSFKFFAQTSSDILYKLIEALNTQHPSLDINKLSAAVASVSGIEQSVVKELLPLIWRWTMVQRRLDMSTEDFVASLTAGLNSLSDRDWSKEDRIGWANVSSHLQKLLSSDTAIKYSAKASGLLLDQQLVLCSSRVITDMRTVFDDSAQEIKGIIPYHTLVLRCHKGSDNHNIYIALDSNDLIALREQIERAEKKEKLLHNTLEKAGFTVIETSAKFDD